MASFESSVAAIEFGVLAMLDFPEQARWLDRGAEAVHAFICESFRYNPPVLVEGLPRIAIEDLTVSGVTIPADADVRPMHGPANRDPEAFPDPDRFDPSRDNARMVTFGYGVHQCLGVNVDRRRSGGGWPDVPGATV